MKIVVIHGQNHKGSTWNVTKLLLNKLSSNAEEIKEFYTNDIPPCTGCFNCILRDENLCPHRNIVGPIIEAIEKSDIIIVESPNYCMGMTGQLKSFFDHIAYRWMTHRPLPSMNNKIGISISTAAGVGAKKVTKSIREQFFWLGIGKVYRLPFNVGASNWHDVDISTKSKINDKTYKVSKKALKKVNKVKANLKTKITFQIMKNMQNMCWNPVDNKYWHDNNLIK